MPLLIENSRMISLLQVTSLWGVTNLQLTQFIGPDYIERVEGFREAGDRQYVKDTRVDLLQVKKTRGGGGTKRFKRPGGEGDGAFS